MRFVLCWILLLPAMTQAQETNWKKKAAEYLQSLQQKDGSFVPDQSKEAKASMRATATGFRALRYLGMDVPNLDGVKEYIRSCFDSSNGGFADRPGGKADIPLTAIGLIAASELQLVREPYVNQSIQYLVKHAKEFEHKRVAAAGFEAAKVQPKILDEWFETIESTKNPDGTFGKDDGQARETGSTTAMMLRVGRTLEDSRRQKIIDVLNAGQRSDGGFGKAGQKDSELESCYRVMRAFYLLKEKPKDTDKLRAFIAKCQNADGGFGVAIGKPSTASGVYYAAVIHYWLDQLSK